LNDISARHVVGLFWVPGHAGTPGNEIADELTRGGSVLKFLGPEPSLGVLDRIYEEELDIGWTTSIGKVLVTPKDRLEI
jgi:hypothetical protein